MKEKLLYFAVALLAAGTLDAEAAPLFDCAQVGKGSTRSHARIANSSGWARPFDARLNALVVQADPLAAMLLRREQSWFAEILGGAYTRSSPARTIPSPPRRLPASRSLSRVKPPCRPVGCRVSVCRVRRKRLWYLNVAIRRHSSAPLAGLVTKCRASGAATQLRGIHANYRSRRR